MTQQTERERLADDLERLAIGGDNETKLCMRKAAALLRGDEQPKPDRAEVLVHELWIMDSGQSQSVWLEVVRRHFTELRAEWEAERQDEPVCFIGKVDCDGNELVTVSKDALDRYKDQARYTYQRAEKAEARVKELEARAQGLVDALEPLAKLEFPQKPSYNAGAYSIFHKDILAARQALATWRRT